MTSDPAPARFRVFTQDQTDAGWRSMSLLARYVQRGGHPAPVSPTMRLRAGEKQYGAFLVDVLAYSSNGVFTGGGVFFSGNAATEEPGWEHRNRLAATITSQRLILSTGKTSTNKTSPGKTSLGKTSPGKTSGGETSTDDTSTDDTSGDEAAESYDFRDLVMVQPNPLEWSVNLYFQGHSPLMLCGPWVPWMTVVMCAELYGSPWPPGPEITIATMCENTR